MSGMNRENLASQLAPDFDREFTAPQPCPASELYFRMFTLNGAGADTDMAVNGTTPKSFRVTAEAGKRVLIQRINFTFADVNVEYQFFAGFGAALSNGITIKIFNAADVEQVDFFDAAGSLKVTGDFSLLAGPDVPILKSGIGGDPDFLAIRWTLAKTGYVPILEAGDYMEIKIQDDLTGLSHFECMAHGRIV